jgi:CubicO group peptidase (beta-lactamase class C family)
MRFSLIIIFALITNIVLAQNPELEKHLSKFVEMEVNFLQSPAVIIGVIEGDSIYKYSFGELTKGKNDLPTDSTIFEIGSLTKVFTASTLQLLVDEGKIEYKKTLIDYLDKDKLHESLHQITVLELATHTSGLPRLPINFGEKDTDPNNPFKYYLDEDLDAFLLDFNFITNGQYLYSHLNYVLIERIIERVEKRSIETVMNEKILSPLNLKQTTYELSENALNKYANSYLRSGLIAPKAEVNSFQGAVGLLSDLDDLARFVQLNFRADETYQEIQAAFAKTQIVQANTGIEKFIDAGIGWHIVRPKKRFYNIISHRGTSVGHQVYVAFVPETQTGIVVLSNSRNSLEGLGFYLLKMVNNNWKRKSLTDFN